MDPQPLCSALLAKIQEQVERTIHLIQLVPEDRLDWQPPLTESWPVNLLFGHLLETLAGFCAVLAAASPLLLAHFNELRNLPVNHACSPAEAVSRIGAYRAGIEEGFAYLTDRDLADSIPTLFVKHGEPLLTLLLGNLEHLINHKHQLFIYLKLMNVPVTTPDLYRFRGENQNA